jgi:hypothetical protein
VPSRRQARIQGSLQPVKMRFGLGDFRLGLGQVVGGRPRRGPRPLHHRRDRLTRGTRRFHPHQQVPSSTRGRGRRSGLPPPAADGWSAEAGSLAPAPAVLHQTVASFARRFQRSISEQDERTGQRHVWHQFLRAEAWRVRPRRWLPQSGRDRRLGPWRGHGGPRGRDQVFIARGQGSGVAASAAVGDTYMQGSLLKASEEPSDSS